MKNIFDYEAPQLEELDLKNFIALGDLERPSIGQEEPENEEPEF